MSSTPLRLPLAVPRRSMVNACCCAMSLLVWLVMANDAGAFFSNGRWTSTATDATAAPMGFPVTLTWSIVADGSAISTGGTSNLISFFDGLYGNGGGGGDLTLRPWFTLVEQSFDRWTDLSGLTFVYEPADDGAIHGNFSGALDVRGDVRLAGKFLDGVGGTNAQAGFIPGADLTVDSGDAVYFGNSSNNFRAMRNTLMHEIGHSFGLGHIDSNSAAFLMEGFSNNAFEGPQLDDVRGVQSLYGDKYERLAGVGGNGSIAHASALGLVNPGSSLTIGSHGGMGTLVIPAETNFVSIANQNDFDFFSFTLAGPSVVDLTLTPLGASYNERIGGSSAAFTTTAAVQLNNLSLELYALVNDVPTLLSSASGESIGLPESLLDVELATAGEYFVRIAGSGAATQLYQLAIGVEALVVAPGLDGDFDLDGDVDGADFLVWQQGVGNSFDADDLALWQGNYGSVAGDVANAGGSSLTIPEPTAWRLAVAATCGTWGMWRRLRSLVITHAFRKYAKKQPLY